MSLSDEQRENVRNRAGSCCEYCLLPESRSLTSFHVDHIRPRQHHGSDDPGNLCFACYQCNAHKGTNIAGYDPLTDALTPLFDPRKFRWNDHFRLERNSAITGLTIEGRATTYVLNLNEPRRVQRRQTLRELGVYPCQIEE